MAPKLKISSSVIQRLGKLKNPSTCRLYGVIFDDSLLVLSFSLDVSNTYNSRIFQLSLPAEIYLCGVLIVDGEEEDIYKAFKDVDVTDNPLLLKYSTKITECNIETFFYIHQKLEIASFEILSEYDIWQKFTYIRLEANLSLNSQRWNILETIEEARKNIAAGKAGFYLPKGNVYLLGEDAVDTGNSELLNLSINYEGIGHSKHDVKTPPRVVDAFSVSMYLKVSKDRLSDEGVKYAPVIQHVKREFDCLEFQVKIDALAFVRRDILTTTLYSTLVESACRNLRLLERAVQHELSVHKMDSFKIPDIVHFRPQNIGHLLTFIFPTNEETALEFRRTLHDFLALPRNQPYFRNGNIVKFQGDMRKNEPLINPHESVPSPGIDAKVALVDGLYAYYHYMQDNFDDNGWGCAYRSLQTIISWFRLQGYTEKSVPTHNTIQKCLVDIGDKPYDFIGSKQWIGSMEVGFVLETLLGITIKINRVSVGEEMASLGPMLESHFATQGTPIMIGGGVLAHTILGVAYNETTGDIKFLILDPHYTGVEILPTILSKGWCGWKTKDFWKKDAFYNLCLPQRPVSRI
ncbi:ufm1-specific protease 2 isoform X2 [Cephus cinctus]|uniref:Probable Ufm1-specific protease 2 n=1 Tax=Cephus cinctus TaxID=211228 RepID=A0AAJ7BYM4_CEPCN|nr:ufm1-specific protease 2 isoform X2 [Cephus cinctus]